MFNNLRKNFLVRVNVNSKIGIFVIIILAVVFFLFMLLFPFVITDFTSIMVFISIFFFLFILIGVVTSYYTIRGSRRPRRLTSPRKMEIIEKISEPKLVCSTCKGNVPIDARYCPYCGTSIDSYETREKKIKLEEGIICSHCGAKITGIGIFCPKCGQKFRDDAD